MRNEEFLTRIENGQHFGIHVHDESNYVELETWTSGGVNMLFTLELKDKKSLMEQFIERVENFDVEEEVDMHREGIRYRNAFSLAASLEDFTTFEEKLKNILTKVAEDGRSQVMSDKEFVKRVEKEKFLEVGDHGECFDFKAVTKAGVEYTFTYNTDEEKNLYEQFKEDVENFDLDDIVDGHRANREYAEAFTVQASLDDFKDLEKRLGEILNKVKEPASEDIQETPSFEDETAWRISSADVLVVLKDHFGNDSEKIEQMLPVAMKAIKDRFYVDDWHFLVETFLEAESIV